MPADAAFLDALVGDWVAEDQTTATGSFTFLPDLQHTVYIRRNHAAYPAQGDTPAYAHDDLLIVYRDPHDQHLAAWYTDNEGHVINYSVRLVGDDQTIEFLSAESANSPRYRLRYTLIGEDQLHLSFAIAPPGQPEAFSSYVESRVRRV